MKKIIFPLILVVILFVLSGCSTKFNVAAPYQNITVIYGFLDRADTAHYIRVQKAFLDQNKNALTMAQSADSNFYAHINVRINRISAVNSFGTVVDTIHLNRVDLNLEGYPKQPGIFFNSPNYAYKFTNDLDPNYLYRIIVTNLTTGQVDSSTSPVIDDITPGTFMIDLVDDTGINRDGLDFSSTLQNQFVTSNISYFAVNNFSFEGLKSPVYLADEIIRFNWVDSNIGTGAKVQHYFDYDLGDQLMPSPAISYMTGDLSLYSALATGMGAAPASTIRLMDRCQVFAYLTTQDYYFYQQSSNLQGVGLTGNEIEPIYTNVQGNNALGLFTARGLHSGYITMNLDTIDSLEVSPIMSKANIRGTIYH